MKAEAGAAIASHAANPESRYRRHVRDLRVFNNSFNLREYRHLALGSGENALAAR
jgi:hypothetical protein